MHFLFVWGFWKFLFFKYQFIASNISSCQVLKVLQHNILKVTDSRMPTYTSAWKESCFSTLYQVETFHWTSKCWLLRMLNYRHNFSGKLIRIPAIPLNVWIIFSVTLTSATCSARASDATFPYSVSRENFYVVWLDKDDGILPNTDGDFVGAFVSRLEDSLEEKFVTHQHFRSYFLAW